MKNMNEMEPTKDNQIRLAIAMHNRDELIRELVEKANERREKEHLEIAQNIIKYVSKKYKDVATGTIAVAMQCATDFVISQTITFEGEENDRQTRN